MARPWTRFALLLLGCMLLLIAPPGCLFVSTWMNDRPAVDVLPDHHVDDASRMNATAVSEVVHVLDDPAAAEQQLRDLLARARKEKRPVAVAGARHSMGGHTLYPGGVSLDMTPFNRLHLDAPRRILRAGAGARWRDIVPYLDGRGFAVAVMQSNNDFSVGGSVSVNCHGWQINRPPVCSTVEGFRLMTAGGTIVRCSRTENAELFGLALGGYGLFGVLLDVDLRVVENERYRPDAEVVAADDYPAAFRRKTAGDDARLAYGRLCLVPGETTFLRHAILTVFRRSPCPDAEIPPLRQPSYPGLRRQFYRAQVGSQAGKEYRWRLEKGLSERIGGQFYSRNQLMNEGAEVYRERNADRTDILHEYFVPPGRFRDFLGRLRTLLPRQGLELMNVTVREVKEDRDTLLRYADRDLFSLVMLFNQARTAEADRQMEGLTQELIDAALACGGRYYLPYRLHARTEQFARAYPSAAEFFRKKRLHDPDGVFQNQFYRKYGKD